MKALFALALVPLMFAMTGCMPQTSADVPFKNANPYRIKAERIVTRQVTAKREKKQVGDISVSKPIYFSERTGHILKPQTVNGQRTFIRSNEILQVGRVYYNVASGQRLQVVRSNTGAYQLAPVGGQYLDTNKIPYVSPPAAGGKMLKASTQSIPTVNTHTSAISTHKAANLILGENRGSLGYNSSMTDEMALNMVQRACSERGQKAINAVPIAVSETSKVLNFTCK